MTGRLGIDDVTPNVGDGHHPSKAVVGEVVPIGATVWREGHDAIAANVVWKKVGSDGPGVHVRMAPDARRRRPLHRDGRGGRAGPVDLPGRRLERPVGDLATRRHRQAQGRAGPGRAGQRPRGRRAAAAARGPPARRARQPRPAVRRGERAARHVAAGAGARRARALPGRPGDHGRAAGPRADHPRPAAPGLRRPSPRAVRLLVRVLPPLHRRPRRERRARARHPDHLGQGARPRRGDGLRRGLPAADPPHRHGAPQGPEHRGDARRQPERATRRRGLALGDRLGGRRARRHPPRARHLRRLRRLRRPRPRPRHGGSARLRAPVRAGPPLGRRAPRVVHRAPRRHHRLRGEPAEEVPGHLPGQLRQRPRRHLRGVTAGGAALGRARRADLPGGQPAHQAGRTSGTG